MAQINRTLFDFVNLSLFFDFVVGEKSRMYHALKHFFQVHEVV